MKKLAFFTMMMVGCALPTLTGCGGSESKVIEAPPEAEIEEDAMEGMTDEEYDQAMEADMEG